MFIRYAFVADSVMLDANGKMSAIGIFDTIGAIQFPTVHRDMTLVANLEGNISEQGEHKITVELRDNDSNKLASLDQTVAFKSPETVQGNIRAGLIVKLQDLLFIKPGRYEFVLFGDDRFLGRVSFAILNIKTKTAGKG